VVKCQDIACVAQVRVMVYALFICILFTFHGSFEINLLDTGIVKCKERYINKIDVCTVIMRCCNKHVIVLNRTNNTSQSYTSKTVS
jgi:hypothetical protein